MPAFKDLTGHQFGRLIVLRRSEGKPGQPRYTCQCECGNVKDILSGSLRSGDTVSCGCYNKTRPRGKDLLKRFETKIERLPECGCWIWTGATDSNGYGSFRGKNGTQPAHRAVYEFYIGSIPEDLNLCHRCDTPSCVNPYHMFPGTQKDNVQDSMNKKRLWRDGVHKNASVTREDIKDIREDPRPVRKISHDYNISASEVGRIKRRERWSHLE